MSQPFESWGLVGRRSWSLGISGRRTAAAAMDATAAQERILELCSARPEVSVHTFGGRHIICTCTRCFQPKYCA